MNTETHRHLRHLRPWTMATLIFLAFVSAFMFTGPRDALAEGSVNSSANGGKRALTEWRTSVYGNLLPRRTLLKVYANAGEVINLGSSAVGVGSGDIVVWTPGQITAPLTVSLPTPAFSCKTAQSANGRLDTRAKELAGPLPNAGGYTPCTYTAATTGTYSVAFYGPLGGNSNSDGNPGTIAVPITNSSQNSGVSMWDVTVRNSANTTAYSGRVFTDYLAQISGGNGVNYRIYSTLYAVTKDGFKYQVDLRGLDPFGFILYGNTVGYLNPDGTTPLYHDLLGGNSALTAPQGGVTLSPPTGLLFFNLPDAALPATIAPTPVTPSVTSIVFSGSAGGNTSSFGTGGNFVYSGNVGGVAEVTIAPNPGSCSNADFNATLTTNRVIRSALPGGVQNLPWDGKDNSGTYLPVSYSGNSGNGYCFKATLHAGEYHFPLLDAENSMLGGPTITLLNAPGGVCPFSSISPCRTAFFDDRGYKTTNGATVGTVGSVLNGNGPPPSPYYSLNGFDTASTTIRAYGNNASNGFGDAKGLDLWTYFPSQDVVGPLYVKPAGTQDLAISKTHSGDFMIGASNTYTITVQNVGTGSIAGLITVTDPVPAGLTLVSAAGTGWNCTATSGQNVNCTVTPSTSLAAGASLPNITVTVTPQAAAATGTDIVNTASVANGNDTNPDNDSSGSSTTISSADLAVTKTASPTSPVEGATVSYTITVTNNGPSTADAVSVADAVPAGLTFVSATPTQGSYADGVWTVGTLLNGATATLTLAATVNLGQSGQTIGNTATVSGGPYEYASGNNTASASLSVPATVLTGVVTDQQTGLPIAGATVQVTDSAAHVYTVTTGADGSYTLTSSPGAPLAAGAATVSASAPGYVEATATRTVVAGETVTQNLALTPLSLSGNLTDLGDGVPIVGATVTLTQGAALPCTTTTTAGGAYSFTHSAGCLLVAGAATVSSSPTGYTTASASPTILDTGPTTQNLQAGTVDLVITKTDGVATVQAGDVLNYVLTVVNNGSIAAEAVTLKDTFPSVCLNFTSDNSGITKTGTGTALDPYTWVKSGSLDRDAIWTFTVTASVKADVETNCPTGITNYAKVFTTSPENNGPNNEVSDIDTVTQRPDLVITKTDGVTQVQAGQTLSYTITYQNTGNKAATDVTIVDTLQSGVEIIDGDLSGGTYVAPNGNQPGTLTWTIGNLPVNGTGSITLSLKVKSDVAPGSIVANRVAVTHNATIDGADPNPGNNTATDSDLVTAPAIVLEKRVSGPIYVGQAVAYSIDWRNVGAATAKAVTITDTLPTNTTLVSGGGTESGGVITWTLGDQDAGASGSVGFQVIPGTSAGGATQTAPTLTTESGNGSVTVTSSTTPLDLPYCKTAIAGTIAVTNASAAVTGTDTAFATELAAGNRLAIAGVLYQVLSVTDATHLTLTAAYAGTTGSGIAATNATCLALMNRYQDTDGTPPTGWNDNPRLTVFDDSAWTQAGEAEPEYPHWMQPDNLSAEWVAPNKVGHTVGNFSFFRQGFCLPLNATGLSARLELAGDDVSTIYLNSSGLGQQIGAGGANAFTDSTSIQAGMNVLAVQLLNNRHGGHPFPDCPGCDHIGLLFNLNAAYTGLRPFVAAPTAVLASGSVTVPITVDETALGGNGPYSYTLTFGDGSAPVTQSSPTFNHLYTAPGTYTATLTATGTNYGCTGSDQVTITVLPATANLLANAASVTYTDTIHETPLTATSGAGLDLDESADLAIAKTITSGGTVPGQGVTYQLVVTNNGPNAVTGATVTDTVPAAVTGVTWTCVSSGGACANASGSSNALAETVDLPVGATATYTITGTVAPGATGTLANSATIDPPAGVTDLVSANNTSTATTSLTTTLDLSINKTSSPANALPGGIITYTITVQNAGPSDAVGARVIDNTPDAVGLVSWTCSATAGSSCSADGTVKIDDTVNVISGGTLTYTLVGTLDPSTAGAVLNTANVTAPSGVTDTILANNSTTDTNTAATIALTGVVKVNGIAQAGVSVTVVDNAGHSYTTTTDASGVYDFVGSEANPLALGTASVMATLGSYVPQVVSTTLVVGQNTEDLSFDSTDLSMTVIGNHVWLDENSDGVQDAGEDGIANLTVELYLAGQTPGTDTPTQTTETDADGGYLFTVDAGVSYLVRVLAPAGLAPTYDEDDIGTVSVTTVPALTAGDEHLSADFGYNWVTPDATTNPGTNQPGALGDHVWNDANGNGVQDPGEAGLAGVKVTIYYDADGKGIFDTAYTGATDAEGTAIGATGTTTTDATGNYIFAGLLPRAYVVAVNPATLPPGFNTAPSGDPDGDGNNASEPLPLAPGDVYLNLDFGYKLDTDNDPSTGNDPPGGSTIGDRIYLDQNGDGNDGGIGTEPGIAGVTVTLEQDDTVIATTATDANGVYSFPGLPAGDYTVVVTDTNNVLGEMVLTGDPDDGNDRQSTTTVTGVTGDNALDQDFGFAPNGAAAGAGYIGDTIFLDTGNGAGGAPDGLYQPGEGLEGVKVDLYDATGANLLASTVTNENGTYGLGGLTPALSYEVSVVTDSLPGGGAGLTNTVDPNGGADSTAVRDLGTTGPIDADADFGYQAVTPSSISGTVWDDSNADGTLNAGEIGNGIAGVTLVLLDNGLVVASTTTDANGDYRFPNLPDGTYQVQVTDTAGLLGGYWKTDGPNDGADGNSKPLPYPVTFAAGQDNETGDFGYYKALAALGNRVWKDDRNGIQQSGELGIANVKLTLTVTYPNGAVSTLVTLTDANGGYRFPNLLADDQFNGLGTAGEGGTESLYEISVETPSGYAPSPISQGTSRLLDSDNPVGTQASVLQGQDNTTLQANPSLEPVNAGYDFGFTAQGLVSCSEICDVVGTPGSVTIDDIRWLMFNRGRRVTPPGTANSGDCVADGVISVNDVQACRSYLSP